MKKIIGVLVICLIFACVAVCGCDVSGIVKKSDEQKAFEKYLLKVQHLYEVSQEYSNSEPSATLNPLVRTFAYLRLGNSNYNTNTWNLVGGSVEDGFQNFIEQSEFSVEILGSEPRNIVGLVDVDSITIPKLGRQLDLYHFYATLNVVYNSYALNGAIAQPSSDLAGWGGDLCQLVVQIKGFNLEGQSQIEAKAQELFNSDNSTFSKFDLNADIDAYNIANKLTQEMNEINLVTIFTNYYKNSESTIKNDFYDNCLNANNDLTEKLSENSQAIFNRLSGNIAIVMWCMQNGINFTNYQTEFMACINTFLQYFN